MCAAWIALEDIHPDSGPLMRYQVVAEKYGPFIARVVESAGIPRQIFLPKNGDVLIWHANLIHGSIPRNDMQHTRRSLV